MAHVLVIEPDDALRIETCACLDGAGHRSEAVAGAGAAASRLREGAFDCVVQGASPPRTWAEIIEEHRKLGDPEIPVFLHGRRPDDELAELAWACRAAGHAPASNGGRDLLACLSRLVVPRSDTKPPAPATGRARMSDVAKRQKRLLLVDDSELTLELVQNRLADAGYDVRIAVAAIEALSIGATWQPDVAIVDLRRPDATESSLCAALKANGVRVTILASSLPEPELARAQRTSSADGYVSKSKGVRAYVSRVEEIVEAVLSDPIEEDGAAKGA